MTAQVGAVPHISEIVQAMTSEQEASVKHQHELQTDVHALAARQRAIAAQVAALIKQNGNGTPQP